MSMSKSIAHYPDVIEVLEVVLAQGAADLTLATNKEARSFRARAYNYRALLREKSHDRTTKYDAISMVISEDKPTTIQFTPPESVAPKLKLHSGATPMIPVPMPREAHDPDENFTSLLARVMQDEEDGISFDD